MSRIVLATLLGVLGPSAALGVCDAIAEREKLMKENGAATRSVQNLTTFEAALQGVTKNCDACHQAYRIKKT
jgi:cytochrome c556